MSVTVVEHPLGSPVRTRPLPAKQVVRVELCVPTQDGDGVTLQGVAQVNVAAAGVCDLHLTPNSELRLAGTWYRVTDPDGTVSAIVVPVSAGPVAFADCLVDEPALPGSVFYLVKQVAGKAPDGSGNIALGPADVGADVAGAAAAAQTAATASANGYTDGKLTAEVARANAAYDATGAAAAAQAAAVTAAEGYTDGKIAGEVSRANAAYDAAGSAGSAQTAAQGYTDTQITGEVARANENYAPAAKPTYASTAAARFDPSRSLYRWRADNTRKIRAALGKARAGTGKATIVTLGDSTTAGYGGTPGTNDWPARLSTILAAQGLPQASEFVPCFNGAGVPNPRILSATNWVAGALAMTLLANATTQDLIYAQATKTSLATARWWMMAWEGYQYAANSGSATAVTVGTPDSVFRHQEIPVTAGSSANFLEIGRNNAAAGPGLLVAGAEFDIAAAGVRVVNLGVGGASAATSFGDSTFQTYMPLLLAALTPDLVICCYGVNDLQSAHTTIPNYTSDMQAGIAMAKAAGADVLLVAENDVQSSAAGLEPYWAALYGLADSQDVPLLDIYDRWGDWTGANTRGLMNDADHPNPTGYADYAQAVVTALLS